MFRMKVDLRLVKNATVKDDRSMLNMGMMLLEFYVYHFFAQIDITHAYFQVAIHQKIDIDTFLRKRILISFMNRSVHFNEKKTPAFTCKWELL